MSHPVDPHIVNGICDCDCDECLLQIDEDVEVICICSKCDPDKCRVHRYWPT